MRTNAYAYVGRTVALTECPAWDADGREVAISGLYDVEEFQPVEPDAGIISTWYAVAPVERREDAGDDKWFTVDPDCLEAQVDPHAYGERLRQDREIWEGMA